VGWLFSLTHGVCGFEPDCPQGGFGGVQRRKESAKHFLFKQTEKAKAAIPPPSTLPLPAGRRQAGPEPNLGQH